MAPRRLVYALHLLDKRCGRCELAGVHWCTPIRVFQGFDGKLIERTDITGELDRDG